MKSKLLSVSELAQDINDTNSKLLACRNRDEIKESHELEAFQLIRINELSKLTTLSKSCINAWVAQSKFPSPIRLSHSINVWRLQDVMCWINSKHGDSMK